MSDTLHHPPKPVRSFKQYQQLHAEKIVKKNEVIKQDKPIDLEQINSHVLTFESNATSNTSKDENSVVVAGLGLLFSILLVGIVAILINKKIKNDRLKPKAGENN